MLGGAGRAWLLLGLLASWGFAPALEPPRQAPTPIAYGQTARNLINHRHHGWTYIFDARRGDLVTITVSRLDGDLDPYVVLQDFYGNPIAEDDDSGGNANARLQHAIREDGRYLIFITRFQGQRAPSAGRFELRLEGLPNGMFGPPPEGYELLRYGAGASNVINAGRREVGYTFVGWRGDTISLLVSRRDGAFTARVEVYMPGAERPFLDLTASADGRILAEGVALPRTGYYTVRVSDGSAVPDGSGGAYQIALEGAPGTPPERAEGAPFEALALGSEQQGSLSDAAPERYYAFDGSEGQFVRATLRATGGDLAPLLILLDENGDEIAFDDAPGVAQIAQARLPRTGRYTLVAGRLAGSGSFALGVRPLVGGELALAEGELAVTLRWDTPADLDLIVRDPAGDALTRDARRVESGGVYEIDANTGCRMTATPPVEHVYWPAPAPSGSYEVVVWNRAACGSTGPATFELVIRENGAEVARERGSLLPDAQYRTVFSR